MKPLLLLLALTGCAPHIEGAYADPQGAPAFRLAHGKYFPANPASPAQRHGQPYKVDGKRVLVEQGRDRAAFEILADGRLQSSRDGQALIFVRK